MLPWKNVRMHGVRFHIFEIDRWFHFWFPFGVSLTGFSFEIDVYHRYVREGKKRRIKVWECRSCLLHTRANKKKPNRFPEESCFLTRINFIATYSCAYTKFKCIADRWDSAIKMSSMASNRWYSLSQWKCFCLFSQSYFIWQKALGNVSSTPNHLTASHYLLCSSAIFQNPCSSLHLFRKLAFVDESCSYW